MKFFSEYYKNVLNRSYIKYNINLLFFNKNNLILLKNILTPHIYINTKNLKIKLLANLIKSPKLYIFNIYILTTIIIISILFTLFYNL